MAEAISQFTTARKQSCLSICKNCRVNDVTVRPARSVTEHSSSKPTTSFIVLPSVVLIIVVIVVGVILIFLVTIVIIVPWILQLQQQKRKQLITNEPCAGLLCSRNIVNYCAI